jgi:hypothetical protein
MKQGLFLSSILLLLLSSCVPAADDGQKNALPYFDLKKYIQAEVVRLDQVNPLVSKTVSIDGSAENKSLKVTSWAKELSALADADINKNSWKGLFSVQKKSNELVYQTDNEKVPVKQLSIRYKNNAPDRILILISNSNLLYSSLDSLVYCPDSLYAISKYQKIRLLTARKYRISIKFK